MRVSREEKWKGKGSQLCKCVSSCKPTLLHTHVATRPLQQQQHSSTATTTTVAAVAGQHFKRIYIMRIFMLALKCNQNALRAISIYNLWWLGGQQRGEGRGEEGRNAPAILATEWTLLCASIFTTVGSAFALNLWLMTDACKSPVWNNSACVAQCSTQWCYLMLRGHSCNCVNYQR